ncbi:hypothetical protein DL764_006141 [Monosporascus ibericus]|uniref:Uncharacterized protein n=1 Tax=Monosporascus ibericus TaxID=155417 RepID=A0A4Q4T5X2_9PEZI|nr:hypothetical protein DL764_006141 [Monosporascus ibericus]
MPSHGEIRFGIETETPLVRTGNDDRDSIANDLLEELRNVAEDIVGFEFKSPAFDLGQDWRAQVRKLWETVGIYQSTTPEHFVQCSTNIHFSLGKEEKTPLEEAQRIIFAAIYFENAIESIMPTHWKARRFFESNMKESQTTRASQFDLTMMQVWKKIREKKSIEDLHDLVCHDKDAYRRAKGLHNKNFKWILKGINYMTIELRQIPVSRSAEDTEDWVDFTAAFVRAALAADTEDLDKATESDTTTALNALFNLGNFGLTDRPAEEAHLQAFLRPHGLDGKFWERREKSRADLDDFMKDPLVV